ncbi:MAG: hypothetical protein D6B25_07865 [Desulfobulbaceae bacterium]|nr:MAG: hypothetical protein D6B25_07865 [Desulfobulbaceae bacterium]
MDNSTEILINLWLIPGISVICVTLSILVLRPLLRTSDFFGSSSFRSRRIKKRGYENRAARRINTNDLRVDVSDGTALFTGLACNISRFGICIMGLPEKVFQKAERLAIVVDYNNRSYSLHVKPVWQFNCESGKQIGASIEYAPREWRDFVDSCGAFLSSR